MLPGLIYKRLAVIRAYDEALATADIALLQGLRLEFKRLFLFHIVALFEDVAGKQLTDFIEEVQTVQSALDRIHAVAMAPTQLDGWINTGKKRYAGILEAYQTHRATREPALIAGFKEHWTRFNSRKVQQKLSTALLALYEN